MEARARPQPSLTVEGRLAFSSTALVTMSSPAGVASGSPFQSLGMLCKRGNYIHTATHLPPRTLRWANWQVAGPSTRPVCASGRAPLLVLILALHKTHKKTCSFLQKKSKQTVHAHRWERCIQKKKKKEREMFVPAFFIPSGT